MELGTGTNRRQSKAGYDHTAIKSVKKWTSDSVVLIIGHMYSSPGFPKRHLSPLVASVVYWVLIAMLVFVTGCKGDEGTFCTYDEDCSGNLRCIDAACSCVDDGLIVSCNPSTGGRPQVARRTHRTGPALAERALLAVLA